MLLSVTLPLFFMGEIMHELSIAYNLVEIADKAASNAGVTRVSVVHLRLGVLSGVEKGALLFAYDIAVKDTCLEGSHLEIEQIPILAYCSNCDAETILPDMQCFLCPHCDEPITELRQGRELELTHLEVDDETTHS